MNPTKTIVDQAEAALRLFFAETREGADLLLSMYGPLVEMRKRSADAADEVRYLVLQRFPASEPPAVPGVDFLPAAVVETAVRDGKQIVAEVVGAAKQYRDASGDLWIDGSGDCVVLIELRGKPCQPAVYFRSDAEEQFGPLVEVLTGEVTSPFGPCRCDEHHPDRDCARFAAEFVESTSAMGYGTLLSRLCTPCADETPDVHSRRPLTHAPGGVPVERAKPELREVGS